MPPLFFKPRALLSPPVPLISAEQPKPKVPEPLCQASGLQHLPFRTGSRPSLSIQRAISSSAKMPAYAGNASRVSGRGRLSKSASRPRPQ
jgi:hypothetical protein